MPKSHKTTQQKLQKLHSHLAERTSSHIGYPINADFDYSKLDRFLKFHLNNCGDPFDYINYQVNTVELEREVIEFFEGRFRIPKNKGWGYVTSGGTEGNLYGLFLAREHYPKGILYYSDQTHYSIGKIARILNIPRIKIPSLPSGEIDYEVLEKVLKKNKDKPAIINANYGTTVKGAIDDIDKLTKILNKTHKKRFYIHADAALFGLMLSYIHDAPKIHLTNLHGSVNSIAISGHKFIGTPFPCGITLTRKYLVNKIKRNIEYLESYDTTITGSRNGLAVLYLWYAIEQKRSKKFSQDATYCLQMAMYLYTKLEQKNYPCFLNPYSNIVIFKKPSKDIIHKWQLATQGKWAHAILMPSVDRKRIDTFLKDLLRNHKS